MNNNHIEILLIEDNPGDARLIREMLADTKGVSFDLECTDRLSAGLKRISAGGIDVVLLDLSLPDSKGLETFTEVHTQTLDVPIIVLSGTDDEELALKAVQEGAQDYLVKGGVDSSILVRSIRYAIERKQGEEALRASEERLKILFEFAPDAYYLSDFEGNFVDGNKAAEELIGYKKDELIGKNFLDLGLLPTEYLEKAGGGLAKNIRGGPTGPDEFVLNRKDGKQVSVEIRTFPLNIDGQDLSLGIARDITERKRAEEELIRSEKLAGIGTLASGIAHEINNPLAGIIGYAEIIMTEGNPDISRQYAEKIIHQAERAADIVKWLSRYSKQAKDSNITDVDLREVIDESLEALKHTRKSHKVEIIKDYQVIPKIRGNRSELQQVFVNLMNNAVDAMETGGRIGFSTIYEDGAILVRASDNGEGIPEDDIYKIFDPFFTTKKVGEGTGLGLYVCSMIMKKHHGTMDVESEEGKGTTFTLRFPVSEVEN